MDEIYPMPAFPQLVAQDLDRSAGWYQAIGFHHIFTMPGPGGAPALVHLRWLKYADLLLAARREGQSIDGPLGVGVSLSFQMFDRFDGSVDALAEQARRSGARILSGLTDQPWNVRELVLQDPDGYRLVFTAPLHSGLTFDQVVQRAAGTQSR